MECINIAAKKIAKKSRHLMQLLQSNRMDKTDKTDKTDHKFIGRYPFSPLGLFSP